MSISVTPTAVTCTVNGTAVTNTTTLPISTALLYDMFYNTYPGGGITRLRMNGWNGVSLNGTF
jgi:hypothetical protein